MTSDVYILSEALGRRLHERHLTLTTAESCTGGGIAQAITDISGSSSWFTSGFVTYSNLAKQHMLAVDASLLAAHGAVSEPVVSAMALGALRMSDSDVGIAVSGVAGPSGGSPEKPVGTVCFAWGSSEKIYTDTVQLSGDRQKVRAAAVIKSLEYLMGFLSD